MRRRVVLPAMVAGIVLVPVAAYGFWTVGSSGVSGAGRAGALGAPTIASAMSNGDVRVSVTAPPASGPRPTSYIVNRTAPTSASAVCTITPVADGTGSCVDPTPVVGQRNTYQVVGKFQDWLALGASVLSTSVDVTLLTTNITAVAASTNVTAGTVLNVTVTARTSAGVADVTFNGTKTILVAGAPTSPNGTAPTVPVTANFTLGVATVPVTLVRAGTTTLTVSAAGFSANTAAITVAPATAATYTLAGPATAQAGMPYTLTSVTAFDSYGNTATGYTGSRVLTWSGAGTAPNGAAPTTSTPATFAAGVASNVVLTFVKAETAALKATTTAGSVTTPTALPVTVSGGVPASAAWSGISSTVPGVGNISCSGTSCTALALGNNGGIAGTISLTDAYGNAAANAGTGWSMTFLATKTKGQGTGDFDVNGTVGNPVNYTIPTNGSSSVNFSYAHPGNADWRDILTITVFRNGVQVTSLTATLDKT